MPYKADTPVRAKADTPAARTVVRQRTPRAPATLKRAVDSWLADGKAQGWQPATLSARRQFLDRFAWWVEHEAGFSPTLDSLDAHLVRAFLTYVREPNVAGRWGTDHHATHRETRPSTVQTYHRQLRAFINWTLAEGLLSDTPLRNVKTPRVPKDKIKPFNSEQLQALVDAARRRRCPDRDVAVVLVLLDTGLRVSELCSLVLRNIDRGSGELTVTGKGNKRRQVYMGARTRRSLWRYLEADRCEAPAEENIFIAHGGHQVGAGLTESGVYQIVRDLGKDAKLQGVRCSPHTLRHTFAVNFLRGGGNLFELQELMGHEDLTVLRRYVELAETDLSEAHRSASPEDRLKLR